MSKVLTFSRVFQAYHLRAGQPTYFVEKIWNVLWGHTGLHVSYKMICDLNPHIDVEILWQFWRSVERSIEDQKIHTIRVGHRFKSGDWFSPRVWSGKPYASKQIQFAPDIQVKKVYSFSIGLAAIYIDQQRWIDNSFVAKIAANDGLDLKDFMAWFQYPKPFSGQIIVWSDQVEY